MLDTEVLRDQAHADCLAHAKAVVGGDLEVELRDADLRWESIELRHVFDQPAVIWRRFGEFEVILNDRNQPVGFVDPAGWKECRWTPIDGDVALALLRETGWMSDALHALGNVTQGERGCAEIRVRDSFRAESEGLFVVRINPASRKVISIVPDGAQENE